MWPASCTTWIPDCALRLSKQDFKAEDVVDVLCETAEGYVHRLWDPLPSKQKPANDYAAKFSTPFNVAVAFVTVALGATARTAFSLMFPPMISEFGWERGLAAGAFSFGFMVSAVVSPIIGKVMDVRGPRFIIEFGALTTTAGLLGASQIASPFTLYLTLAYYTYSADHYEKAVEACKKGLAVPEGRAGQNNQQLRQIMDASLQAIKVRDAKRDAIQQAK